MVLDSFITFLLTRIGNVIDEDIRLLRGLKEKLKEAESELSGICAFLRDADESASSGNHQVRARVGQIREAGWDLEDLLTLLSDKAEKRRHSLGVRRVVRHLKTGLENLNVFSSDSVVSELTSILEKLSRCRSWLQAYGVREAAGVATSSREGGLLYLNKQQIQHRRNRPIRRESDIMLEELSRGVELLAGELAKSGDDSHRFFSISGMGGIGKTTLARHVYLDAEARSHFNLLAWAQIFPHFDPLQVWETILKSLLSRKYGTDAGDEAGIISKWENDMAIDERLSRVLKEDKCLVVLDDVWNSSTWCRLSPAFVGDLKDSRILITTRNKEALSGAAGTVRSYVYEPRCIDDADQCWNFFARKANFDNMFTTRDKEKMKQIAVEMLPICSGLPLAMEVLAGVLSSKQTVNEWELVRRNISSYIRSGDISTEVEPWQYNGVLWVLGLSYDDLSYPLKQCFLHLAHFTNDNVSMNELHRIWMAEGMVSSEDEASAYFEKLASRYMVQVTKRSLISGVVKKYRIHSLVKDMCFAKAREENFLQVSHFVAPHTASASKQHPHHRKPQRLAVYLGDGTGENLLPLISDTSRSIKSFVCFNGIANPYLEQVMKPLLSRFQRLRVLKFENRSRGEIGKLPGAIGELIHLRFLSLKNNNVTELPSSIRKLRRLQTLDLRTNWRLLIPDKMFKSGLAQLRHLYFPREIKAGRKVLPLDKLADLRTLVNVPAPNCNINGLAQLPNLRKLKLCAWTTDNRLATIPPFERLASLSVSGASPSFVDVSHLVSSCPQLVKLHLKLRMETLPDSLHFCPNLQKLSLRRTYLQHDPMVVLEALPRLKVLRFNLNSFVGDQMKCSSATGFPNLESLRFHLEDLRELVVVEGAFPRLHHLDSSRCPNFVTPPQLHRQNLERNARIG